MKTYSGKLFVAVMAAELLFCNQVIYSQIDDSQSKAAYVSQVWMSDNGDGTFSNPILYADYSDPDVIRVGDNYFNDSLEF